METPVTKREIEPKKEAPKEVGELGGLARVEASGEPPEGLAKKEILEAADDEPRGVFGTQEP